jgi:hypothetical protein
MATPQTPRITIVKTSTSKIPPTEVQQFIDSLPVQKRVTPAQMIKRSIAQESDDLTPPGESAGFQAFLTALSWTMFAVAFAGMGWLTMSTGMEYLSH